MILTLLDIVHVAMRLLFIALPIRQLLVLIIRLQLTQIEQSSKSSCGCLLVLLSLGRLTGPGEAYISSSLH
jgi:hypothetical protein